MIQARARDQYPSQVLGRSRCTPFLAAGTLIPAMGLLALRSMNRRTIGQAPVAAEETTAGSTDK